MVQPGLGLDTPRTNLGDADYLDVQPDFDISPAKSFHEPSKDTNIFAQLRNGRRGLSLNTPRSRAPFGEKQNIIPPSNFGGAEFTPLLKTATRNSARKFGKENNPRTPAFLRPGGLDNVAEELTPAPYGSSPFGGTDVEATPVPQLASSSAQSTPTTLFSRRDGGTILQNGNALTLKEQENVIDKIEKENFGLKLKIHFLEEALRKAGPGFSEAALKENTDLKVDKVTMQKELHRYRKTLTSAEQQLEAYRQQIQLMDEKRKHLSADDDQQDELRQLRQALEERDAELQELQDRVDSADGQDGHTEKLRDEIADIEAELREKERLLEDRDDEIENLKAKIEEQDNKIDELDEDFKAAQRANIEMEENLQSSEDLVEAKEIIAELQADIKQLKDELEDAKEDEQAATTRAQRVEDELRDLKEEMITRSSSKKGVNKQLEERSLRLQQDLDELRQKHNALEADNSLKTRELKKMKEKVEEIEDDADARERKLNDELQQAKRQQATAENDLRAVTAELQSTKDGILASKDEKNLLLTRHDALTSESSSLQRDLSRARSTIEELQRQLDHEKTLALSSERELRDQIKDELDRLHDTIEDLKADVREKERVYDEDSDKWESEKRQLQSQCERAEEQAAGLKRTIEQFKVTEGSFSNRETKLQQVLNSEKDRHSREEALMSARINELETDTQARQQLLEDTRNELALAKEELRLTQRDQTALLEKVQGLEDEIEILSAALEEDGEQAKEDVLAARQESDSLRTQLRALKQSLSKAEAAAADAKLQAENYHGDLQADIGSREHLTSRIRSLESQLSSLRSDKQRLQNELSRLEIEIIDLQTSNAAIEAERDEARHLLDDLKLEEGQARRLDQEKSELRKTKSKLDLELRQLREEHKAVSRQQQALQQELQEERDRANAEESRLLADIAALQNRSLQLSPSREAKRTVQKLEARVRELEAQIKSNGRDDDTNTELTVVLRDLSSARSREKEYIKREVAQKETIRSLRRQIQELESKMHLTEVSKISVLPDSTLDSVFELGELRHQLKAATHTARDLRNQLKDAERNASRKSKVTTTCDLNINADVWEQERARLERDLSQALLERDEILMRSKSADLSVSQYKSKVAKLERELHHERLGRDDNQSISLERRDLHHMLRTAQIELEQAQRDIKARNGLVIDLRKVEDELRSQLKQLQSSQLYTTGLSGNAEVRELIRRFEQQRQIWEEERRRLTNGVRFANTSMSSHGDDARVREFEEREKRHVKELRGLAMQIEWLRARCKREENLRLDAAYAKRFMQLQIEMFEACNQADLRILRNMGINPPKKPTTQQRPKLHTVAVMIRAIVRMKRNADKWAKSRKIHDRLVSSAEASRKRMPTSRRSSTTPFADATDSPAPVAPPHGFFGAPVSRNPAIDAAVNAAATSSRSQMSSAGGWRGRAVV